MSCVGLALTMVLALAMLLAACGSAEPSATGGGSGSTAHAASTEGAPAKPTKVTLILDFIPNAVHAGIYRALVAGYYRRENIDLQVVQPTSTQETLKLIDAGKAQFGLADGSDVAGLIDEGGDAQAVMALVQRPLGGLIALASEHLSSPADLAGRTVGITGVPSDLAVLDTELRHAGVSPNRVHVVTVGFNGSEALLAGRIAAFTGFIPDEGVTLQASGHPITAFALDENGGPAVPGPRGVHDTWADRDEPEAGEGLRGGDESRLRRHAAGPGTQLGRSAELEPVAPSQPDGGLARCL